MHFPDEMGEACGERKCIQEKSEGKRTLGKPRYG
jgi:hypothetical protein